MKPEDIMDALNDIDYDMVEEAEPKGKRKAWHAWAAVAACLALAVTAFALLYTPKTNNAPTDHTQTVSLGGVERRYKETSVIAQESALVFPWEYQTMAERYSAMTFESRSYRGRCREVSASLLGETLGTCQASGYDIYTEQEYTDSFEVRAIAGIDTDLLVGVKLDDGYYVFMDDTYDDSMLFGAFYEGLDLSNTLTLTRFTQYEGYTPGETRQLTAGANAEIWGILAGCSEGEFVEEDGFFMKDREYLSFTATSEALGIYKKVFYVTRDGYVSTNIFEWGYCWYIGEEAAGQIIDCALSNSEEAEPEPYTYRLAGTVTQIGDGYFLVDDSVLAADPEDGMVFRIPTDDIRISRWLDFGGIGVGDIVSIEYTGGIDVENQNTVTGACSVSEARIADAPVLIPE